MDARAPALSAATLLLFTTAAIAASRSLEAQGAHGALHEASVDESLDAETLADLDELLLDPVDLARGEARRLRVVPWLSNAQVEALRRALPLRTLSQLARLDGWDSESARSVLPFVRFSASRSVPRSSWRAELRSAALRSGRDLRLRAEGSALRIGLRWNHRQRAGSRYVMLDARSQRAVIGDLRAGISQGLVWWSTESNLRAGSAPFRNARGLEGFDGRTRTRVVRGVGAELEWGAVHVVFVQGAFEAGKVRAGALRLVLFDGHRIGVAALRSGTRHATSLSWSRQTRRTALALEVGGVPTRPGMVFAARGGSKRLRLAGRWRAVPANALPPLAAASRSERTSRIRDALLQATTSLANVRLEVSQAHSLRVDSLGARVETNESKLYVTWRLERDRFEVRLRRRTRKLHAIALESNAPVESAHTRGVILRWLRRWDAATTLTLEYRGVESATSVLLPGSAWQARLQRSRGALTFDLALTTFEATSGLAAPVVADPGVAGGATSRKLLGDGVRAAFALRLTTARFEWRFRVARSVRLALPNPTEVETSLRVRLPQ
ncbi:MAG: hypothetical protein JSW67_07165 [Candidatus Latescibacterota bacterium]|nr:MAG: hypothetical protein JSW67_07165 [Candidatus Latescibacterota bacterium]